MLWRKAERGKPERGDWEKGVKGKEGRDGKMGGVLATAREQEPGKKGNAHAAGSKAITHLNVR